MRKLRKQDKWILAGLLFGFFMFCAGLAFVSTKVIAQVRNTNPCRLHQAFNDHLVMSYSETPIVYGTVPDGRIIEVYANIVTGTWTLLISYPDGTLTCGLASGLYFSIGEYDWPKTIIEPLPKASGNEI